MKRILFSLAVLAASMVSSQVLIDDTGNTEAEIHESAALQINSNDKGLLLPRLAEEPQNAVGGLVYFDTNGKCLKAYDGTAWQVLGTECIPPTAYTINIEPSAEVNEGETLVYQISVSPEITDNTILTVDYATYVPSPSNPDDATPDEDYTAKNANITFTSDASTIDIEVETINDNITEVDEKVYVQISNAVHVQGYSEVTIGTESAWGIITDNDVAYTLSVSTNSVIEGEVQEFVVSLNEPITDDTTISVGYTTADGTATAASDYTSSNGTLNFDSTTNSRVISVNTTDDQQQLGDKTYFLNLSNLSLSNSTGNHTVEYATGAEQTTATIRDAVAISFTETFNNITLSNSGTYSSTHNFTGADSTTWTCRARTDLDGYGIDGNGFMFRDASINSINYCDVTFPNGISTLKFDYRSAYTGDGDRNIKVKMNGVQIGTTGDFPVRTSTTTLSPSVEINEEGPVTLRIEHASDGKQAVIDNVTWTR